MAFTVTPTSGASPYTLAATITNYENIDGVNYVASVTTSVSAGSCPAEGTGSSVDPSLVAALVAGDPAVISSGSVPSGSCRVYTLMIRRVVDNLLIASSNATVDNV